MSLTLLMLADTVLRLTPDSPAAAVRTVNEVLKMEASTDLSDLVSDVTTLKPLGLAAAC